MKHNSYSLTELIRNDDFIAWVRHPDVDNDARWQRFLEDHPEKRKVVEDARGYVILLGEDTGKNRPSIEQTNKMWRVVESHLHEENVEEVLLVDKKVSRWQWIRIAASIALISGITSLSFWYFTRSGNVKELSSNQRAVKVSTDLIEKINNTSKPMTILLADGSSVVLQPGARLTFSSIPKENRREVNLVGKAFFEIVKNPSRPFIVYTDGIATKVLGTSFLIDAPHGSEEVKVEVKTGRVSVFQSSKDISLRDEEAAKPELKGIILTHNEKIAISRQSGKTLSISKVDSVPFENVLILKESFVFDETPASEVFDALEKAYNIRIVYNQPLLRNCPLNATLIGQPFAEKLTVICAALDAQFEIKKDEVIITGSGCK